MNEFESNQYIIVKGAIASVSKLVYTINKMGENFFLCCFNEHTKSETYKSCGWCRICFFLLTIAVYKRISSLGKNPK